MFDYSMPTETPVCNLVLNVQGLTKQRELSGRISAFITYSDELNPVCEARCYNL